MIQANLIPIARQDIRARRVRLRRWLTACTCYCILLVAAYGMAQGVWGTTDPVLDRDVVHVSDDISFAKAEIGKVQPRLQDAKLTLAASRAVGDQPDWSALLALLASQLNDPKAERFPGLEAAQARLEALAWTIHPNYAPILNDIIDRQLHNIVLAACSVDPIPELQPGAGAPQAAVNAQSAQGARYLVVIRGLGKTPGSVSQFVLRLEQTDLFQKVTLIESKRTATGEREAVNFRIECVLGK